MRLNSIRIRTMLVLLAVCILIILVFGGIELFNAQQGIKNDTKAYDQQDSRYLANYVHLYMDNITSEADIVSTSPDTIRAINARDIPHLTEIADNLKNDTAQSVIVSFIDGDGNLLYSTKNINIATVRSYDWYGDASKSTTKYVTGVYYSNTLNDYAIALLDPIQENHSILGRTMIIILPQTLQDSIQSQVINQHENVLIVDRDGLVVSHDNRTQTGIHTNVSSDIAVQNVLHGKEGTVEDGNTWDHQPRISAYYPAPDLGWGVIVSTPTNFVDTALENEAKLMLGVFVIFVAGLILLGFFVSNYLTAPIIRLSETMRNISSGNYHERAMIRRADEIGDMAVQFNTMMDELEQAQDERKKAKESAELYVDILGHDINNMNQVALGYVELTMDSLQDGKHDLSLLEKTREMLINSSMLIENVSKIQKIKAGEVRPEAIDLDQLLKEVIDKYSMVRDRDIRINYHAGSKCKVLASELLLDVFANLIMNSIKHSTGPLTIDIDATNVREQGKDYCRVAVSDNGPGIPDDIKKVLFNRFSRGSTKARGSGLGLYIVKSLVESFKGRVWVEDRVPGDSAKGARFVIQLLAIE